MSTDYFGDPWPSGICDDGVRVETPVGKRCELCDVPIAKDDQGTFIGNVNGALGPVHRECSLRMVVGGIGHLTNHTYWCGQHSDPDGGLTYRESAIEVWRWLARYAPR